MSARKIGLPILILGFGAVVELSFLKGVEAIRRAHPDVEVHALVRY